MALLTLSTTVIMSSGRFLRVVFGLCPHRVQLHQLVMEMDPEEDGTDIMAKTVTAKENIGAADVELKGRQAATMLRRKASPVCSRQLMASIGDEDGTTRKGLTTRARKRKESAEEIERTRLPALLLKLGMHDSLLRRMCDRTLVCTFCCTGSLYS